MYVVKEVRKQNLSMFFFPFHGHRHVFVPADALNLYCAEFEQGPATLLSEVAVSSEEEVAPLILCLTVQGDFQVSWS